MRRSHCTLCARSCITRRKLHSGVSRIRNESQSESSLLIREVSISKAAFLIFSLLPLLLFCLSFVTFPLFLSHPPSHSVLLPSAFSLPYPGSFCLSSLSTLSSLPLVLLDREEVAGLFVDPLGLERWSSLSCNPVFIRSHDINFVCHTN